MPENLEVAGYVGHALAAKTMVRRLGKDCHRRKRRGEESENYHLPNYLQAHRLSQPELMLVSSTLQMVMGMALVHLSLLCMIAMCQLNIIMI